MTAYPDVRAVARKAGRERIVIGGVDVTGFRFWDNGKPYMTPTPRFSLCEPFAYGATSIQFPQIHAGYEADAFGQPGELQWVRHGAEVIFSRVWDDTGVEVIDYRGIVISIEPAGRVLNLDIGGQFSGPANMLQEVPQMVRRELDVGNWAARAAGRVGLSFDDFRGPDTGIELTHTGGQTLLSWSSYFCAMSQDGGLQRVLMPTFWGSDTWHFPVKDYTTVHATAFHNDARVVLDVSDDISEQPNVIYGQCIGPDGVRHTNAKWPNVFAGPMPDYPKADGTAFGVGFTNADTVNGDGIDILWDKLRAMEYLPFSIPNTGVYTSDFAKAVNKLKGDAGLTQNGNMTLAAWKALYNTDVTGYSVVGAFIAPLAEDDRVREWNRAANGAILSRNPLYDPTVPRVEVFIDYGPGMRKAAMFRHARGKLARSQATKNWTGTLRFNNAGLFAGDQRAADRNALNANPAAIMPMRDLRPGMNVFVPDFDGGTLFHVAGCDIDESGVTATIDTQARDLVEVREIRARNAESRIDVRREWNIANRPAKKSHAMVSSDENFGERDTPWPLVGGQWNMVPIIAGQHGQINRVDIRLVNDAAEFAYMVTTDPMGTGTKGGVSSKLMHRVGNPLAISDEGWLEKDALQSWMDDRIVLDALGDGKQPCGYGNRRKRNDAGNLTGAPITGRLLSDVNFAYICAPHTQVILYLAIYPDRDCTLKKGKILYCQLDDAA